MSAPKSFYGKRKTQFNLVSIRDEFFVCWLVGWLVDAGVVIVAKRVNMNGAMCTFRY